MTVVRFAIMDTGEGGERIFYKENFHMVAFYRNQHSSVKANFIRRIQFSLKCGAGRGENVEMHLETERSFMLWACSCTYLWCNEYNLIINPL